MDYVFNGQANGSVASVLMANNFDTRALKPYIGSDGRSYITVNQGGQSRALVTNTPATLRKDEWIELDRAVLKAAKERLSVVSDLRSAGLTYNIPNGMGKTVLEYEAQSDVTGATTSMDGIREGDRDRPQYDLRNLPLPITHKDFSFSARQLAASRNGGSPLDTTMAELAGRRVSEEVEKMVLGKATTVSVGGGQVYGFTNFPNRLTHDLTAPTASNQATTLAEVLAMRKKSTDAKHYGPWALYYGPGWYGFMDGDYVPSGGTGLTLRQRLAQIEGITAVRPADYLTDTEMVLVQQTSDVVRLVDGMQLTTVQWETMGGMQLNYKVMCICVPQLRNDYYNNTGIVHGSVA